LVKVLVVGAGVIGTVYGAQLGAAGHSVAVLEHGSRSDELAHSGLVAHDVTEATSVTTPVVVVSCAGGGPYDLVLVTVRAEQIASVFDTLRDLADQPAVLFFGNNPGGRATLPPDLPGRVHLGFPGVGGSLVENAVEYLRIRQQPTTLETGGGQALDEFETALVGRGFVVARTSNIDGWLVYHAVFVAAVAAALSRCHGSATELASNRATLTLMCRAITEGFGALRRDGTRGAPRNLRTLHHSLLRPIAVAYWARTMRSPMGELCFAAHARHAEPEMRALASEVLRRLTDTARTRHLRQLLDNANPE
jgi:2-dehydropantoate 2-reductase